jgi:hypothetical protein
MVYFVWLADCWACLAISSPDKNCAWIFWEVFGFLSTISHGLNDLYIVVWGDSPEGLLFCVLLFFQTTLGHNCIQISWLFSWSGLCRGSRIVWWKKLVWFQVSRKDNMWDGCKVWGKWKSWSIKSVKGIGGLHELSNFFTCLQVS